MLYNREKKAIKTALDCNACPYMNSKTKECKGLGKICFEYDEKTQTCIDPILKLPIKLKNL